ncbi:MAG: acetate--CoA ligase family protein [Alphaproteobacteria bacterium]
MALVGASTRLGSYGNEMVREIRRGGFRGAVYPVNPKYDEVEGLVCYPSLAALPEPVDLAVLAVANHRLEAVLKEAAAQGVRAAVIFASCYLEGDREPPLLQRLDRFAREAGMAVCGGNGMGFYNLDAGIRAFCFQGPDNIEPGPITLITHSGSAFGALVHNDPRLTYNLAVSPGQEIATTTADYMDFALGMPSTRVIALFIEAVRDPSGFVAALEKALARDVPVVALKVGRTEESARLAVSHCGALAGDDAAFEAVCERYGVLRVDTMDELAATALLLAQPRRPVAGGLAAILDSGGEREMLMDLADDAGVPFARISPSTRERLASRLEYGLEPVNPLDAWGTGHDFETIFTECFAALLDDPDTAIGLFCADARTGHRLHEAYAAICQEVFRRTDKPVCMATNFGAVQNDELAQRLTRDGVPVLDGTWPALTAIRHGLAYRDLRRRPPTASPAGVGAKIRRRWRERLARTQPFDDVETLALLTDYGIPVAPARAASDAEAAVEAARDLGYPVAVKTAAPGILHKSDVDGVKLGLKAAQEVREAYEDLAARLGPRVLVARMASPGVEMALGLVVDPQFGPMVMAAAGGMLVEVLRDRRFALAPVDGAAARRLVDGLAARRLLDSVRGRPPADVDAFVEGLVRLSVLAAELGDLLETVDVNPFIVGTRGCMAVDALVVPKGVRAAQSAPPGGGRGRAGPGTGPAVLG